MKNYEDVSEYLKDLNRRPELAVISLQMAADALGVTRAAVERQVSNGALEGFKIGNTRVVLAGSVTAKIQAYDEKVAKIRKLLEGLARKKQTTTYAPVMEAIGMRTQVPNDRSMIGKILGDISNESNDKNGFMLSALVFNANAKGPSKSFYGLADGLKFDVSDKEKFLRKQLSLIWAHYA